MASNPVSVFGGSGFLGRQIVRQLVAQGTSVRVAVRHPRDATFPEVSVNEGQIEPICADVRDEASVAQAVEGTEAVVNSVGLYVERGDETFEAVHVRGARNVARQAARAGVQRLVHISGIGADPNSESSYVRARAQGESLVRGAFDGATILRPSVLFGPGDAFFHSLTTIIRLSPVLPLFGSGGTLLQPVFFGDVAEAVARALTNPASRGQVYELGGPRVYSYKALVEMLLAHLKRTRILVPVPFALWGLQTAILGLLPNPPLTRDQVILMKRNNVVGKDALTLADLGIEPTAVETQLPTYIHPDA